jgi:hypothetical protein
MIAMGRVPSIGVNHCSITHCNLDLHFTNLLHGVQFENKSSIHMHI